MAVTGIKYCGGCNPRIDRSALVRKIGELLPSNCRLETVKPTDPWDAAVLVCGCPVACADRPEVRNMARRWIRVGGTTVDLEDMPEERMARIIVQKLSALK